MSWLLVAGSGGVCSPHRIVSAATSGASCHVKSATGLGLMAGPSLGSLIYGQYGYAVTFYFFSIFIFLAIILQLLLIPNSQNKPKDEEMEDIFL